MTRLTSKTIAVALVLLPTPATLGVVAYPTASRAQTLPNPYVSRALDAVLLPIDTGVVDAFGLAPDEVGVLVLSVQPGGVAEAIGVEPGDVISAVEGYAIVEPIDLDTVVYYYIGQGLFDFLFDGWRAGATYSTSGQVTYESYMEVIEVTSIETWSSFSYESFSYSEFYSEYSEVITESYETSESYIEETATSEEFIAEVATDETDMTAADETMDATADSDGDGILDAEDADDDNDGISDVDDGSDSAMDDSGDAGADDAGADDAGADDAGSDDGGDDSGGDVVEE